MKHPRDVLLGAQSGGVSLPVCDHYSGVEARMRKSLQLQADMTQEFGACVFDVTLDCEDGAPIGGEADHAALVTELLGTVPQACRVGVRLLPVDHPDGYGPTGTVIDSTPRTVSNLIVDQTPGNPAAIVAALSFAGIENADAQVAVAAITAAYAPVAPADAAIRAKACGGV